MFMINKRFNAYHTLIMLGVVVACFQACGKSETNSGGTTTTPASGASVTNKSAWRIDGEETHRGDVGTNGLKCVLWMSDRPWYMGQQPPACKVCVITTTTNHFDWCWKGYLGYTTNYLEIELMDFSGKPVQRTALGSNYTHFPSQPQVDASFTDYLKGNRRMRHFTSLRFEPDLPLHQFTSFSIPELFQIKEAGEYTLRVHIRLLQKPNGRGPGWTITPVPEVVIKIQIRSNESK